MSEPIPVVFALTDDVDTGTITRWFVAEGEAVASGQSLVEVEADKATLEVPAPRGGVVTKLEHPVGTELKAGDVLAWIHEAPTKPVRARHLRLRVHGLCPGCGTPTAVNGAWPQVECARCGYAAQLQPGWWTSVFARIGKAEEVLRIDHVGWRFTVLGSKTDATCHNCLTALPVDLDTPMHEIRCGRCGLVHDCSPAPSWLTEADPTVVRTVGGLAPPTRSLPDACPRCEAKVHRANRSPTPRCQQCDRDIVGVTHSPVPRAWSVLRG